MHPHQSFLLYIKDPAFCTLKCFDLLCAATEISPFNHLWNYRIFQDSSASQKGIVLFFSLSSFSNPNIIFCVIYWAITIVTFSCIHVNLFSVWKTSMLYAFLFSGFFGFPEKVICIFVLFSPWFILKRQGTATQKLSWIRKHAAKKLFNPSSWIPPF